MELGQTHTQLGRGFRREEGAGIPSEDIMTLFKFFYEGKPTGTFMRLSCTLFITLMAIVALKMTQQAKELSVQV